MDGKHSDEHRTLHTSSNPKPTVPTVDYYHEVNNAMNLANFPKGWTILQVTFFKDVITPYIIHSVIGTLHGWEQQSKSHDFIYASWFHLNGFKNAFLSALESALSKLRYTRVDLTTFTLNNYLTDTNPTASHITSPDYLTTWYWGVDTTTGVGFVGDRQGDKDVSTEIRNLLANLPQQVFSAVLHSPVFSRWNWQEKTSGTQKKTIPFPQLVPPTRYDIDTQSFYVDFTTIGLSIALEPGTRVIPSWYLADVLIPNNLPIVVYYNSYINK